MPEDLNDLYAPAEAEWAYIRAEEELAKRQLAEEALDEETLNSLINEYERARAS